MISVIIPLYNAESYIAETLNSVLAQSYPDWECIIVDDGSTDNSAEVVARYLTDGRFRYVCQQNAGPSAARNHGLRLSKGDYIQYLDADDALHPNRFEILLKQYEAQPRNVILYTGICLGSQENINHHMPYARKTSIKGQTIDFMVMYEKFGLEFSFIPGAILFPRHALKKANWNEKMRYSEDWDYYLQLTSQGYIFKEVNAILFVYRMVCSGLSKQLLSVLKANYDIIEKYCTFRNFHITLNRTAANLYKNILHIKHHRVKRIVVPRMSIQLFFIVPLLPLALLSYIIKLNK